ncbi:MAG TPA: hypothetical protein EYN66_03995 [Myxococcales bacterium]|nr:hypothetical protein [Myxococcales bacterium]
MKTRVSLIVILLLAAGGIPSASAQDDPVLTLLKTGHGKKQKLRYSPVPGTVERMKMTMDMNMRMDAGPTRKSNTALPQIVMEMEVKVISVDKMGRITHSFKIDKVSVAAADSSQKITRNAMQQALSKMNGISGKATINNRGITEKVKLFLPKDMDPAIRDTMENVRKSMKQLSAPLPKQAVGVGAQWKVLQKLKDPRLKLEQESVVTLKAIKNRIIELKVDLTQHTQPGPINFPGAPPGMKVSLKAFKGSGGGTISFDLNRIVPTHSTMSTQMVQDLEFSMAGANKQRIKMDMNLVMTVSTNPKKR